MPAPGEVSYRNKSEGQSQEQRERGAYHVSAHGKLEDYLWICSRTGGAGRDRRLVGEIREVPAMQRQAALEQGTDDNWNKARNLKEVCVWGGGENRYSTKGREKKSSGSRRGRRNEEGRGRWGMRGR